MAGIRSFRELDTWRVAMDLVELTYRVTADFPGDERFGLISQMRRAAVSIPSNVAEAHGVEKPRWRLRHLRTAIGSSCELDTQLDIAVRLKYTAEDATQEFRAALDRVQKLLYGMKREKERRLAASAGAVIIVLGIAVRLLV